MRRSPKEGLCMLFLAIVSALLSAATCYAAGYAVVAPRDAYLRTKRGVMLLVVGVLSFATLPPQLPGLAKAVDSAAGGMADVLPGLSLTWPGSISPGAYMALWIATSLAAFLAGMRIWNAGKSGWRPGSGGAANDSSAAGRAAALIAMANGLDEVFDALRRTGTDVRGVDRIAEEIRTAGRRYGGELPAESGAAYSVVASKVGAALAPNVTRYLLEGAGRGGQIASVRR